jgi:hypothetical protein
MINVLADSSFLVALGYPRDRNHSQAKQLATRRDVWLMIPDVVIPETMYNIRRLSGVQAALRFGDLLVALDPPFIPLTAPDFARAIDVMRTYRDADLDVVDCCLTAIAERMNITRICTFDRRDFSIIRPRHTDYFELLP